jgi:flavin reductase (DIM6/NTAB) family NADH-FMN oxidoreductase RutF
MSSELTFQSLAPSDLAPRDIYRLLTSIVVPRPIAWIATRGATGAHNLAPFSFYNAVSGSPPLLMVSIGSRHGVEKDTLRNLRETGDCIVHVATVALAESINATSAEVEPDVDEFELAGLAHTELRGSGLRRIDGAPVAMEGRAIQFISVATTGYTIALIEIHHLHVRSDLLRASGLVDPALLDPLGRLGGDEYWEHGQVRVMPRPPLPSR